MTEPIFKPGDKVKLKTDNNPNSIAMEGEGEIITINGAQMLKVREYNGFGSVSEQLPMEQLKKI
jgi:hypothetical protein